MPEISIIIPTFNAKKSLEKCLTSISNQTFKNFEIIVVNDGSTDNTAAILSRYQDKIKVINQHNAGAAVARNRGEKDSTAPFIIFCDADIEMKPTMLEKMYRTLKNHPEASYVYSGFKFGFKTFKLWAFDPKTLKQMPYIHTTSLIRHDHFPGFDKNLTRFQDWDLWLTMLNQSYVGYYIPEILFKIKAGGTMSSWLPNFIFRLPLAKGFNKVKKYRQAEKIIKDKHSL